jgi:penicillin-binding protein 1C
MHTTRLARLAWRLLIGSTTCGLILIVLTALIPLPTRLTAEDASVIAWRDGSAAHVRLAPDGRWRTPTTLDAVDPAYVTGLLRLEDKRFFQHPGVDPIALARSLSINIARGRAVTGASTITMQLVRVLEPRPRTLTSKVIEAFRAFQLEGRMSKQEILTQYMRFVPFGRNIEGVDAASMAYFGHRADALTPAEIATLLAVPQSPTRRYPSARNADRLRAARDDIAKRLLEEDALPRELAGRAINPQAVHDEIVATPVPTALRPFPRAIPHVADWLIHDRGQTGDIHTTLDQSTQLAIEQVAQRHRAEAASQGAHNISVVVVDHATGELRGLLGNVDFEDVAHAGQIVGFDSPRSTGSLLKPLILALAVDQGIAHPRWLVPDVPRAGAYSPKNFDGRWAGLVRLEDALTRSLNVPFVDLLERLGVARLVSALKGAGWRALPPDGGLALAIGGVEATPLEVAGLYTALASDGQTRPLRISDGVTVGRRSSLMSMQAAWIVRGALLGRGRPDMPSRTRLGLEQRQIAWKTGTSQGWRDAWTAGIGAGVTAVVWVGNFDYSAGGQLTGTTVAAPILFDTLEAIERDATPAPRHAPEGTREVAVCALSGRIATPACPHTELATMPQVSVAVEPCAMHQTIDIDLASGKAVHAACAAGRATERRTLLRLPAGVAERLGDGGLIAQSRFPGWAPGCGPTSQGDGPALQEPEPGTEITLVPGLPADRQRVPLRADAPGDRIDWFIDDVFLTRTRPGERAWWVPSTGRHVIMAQDAAGRAVRRSIMVQGEP